MSEQLNGWVCFWCGEWSERYDDVDYILGQYPTDRPVAYPKTEMDPCGKCLQAMRQGVTLIEISPVKTKPTDQILRSDPTVIWATGRWIVLTPGAAAGLAANEETRRSMAEDGHVLVPTSQFSQIYERAA